MRLFMFAVIFFLICGLIYGVGAIVKNPEKVNEFEAKETVVVKTIRVEQELITQIKQPYEKKMFVTAYCLDQNPTASGLPVGEGVVAVDNSFYQFGSIFRIAAPKDYGYFIALDNGSLVKGDDRLDIWVRDCQTAYDITGEYIVEVFQ